MGTTLRYPVGRIPRPTRLETPIAALLGAVFAFGVGCESFQHADDDRPTPLPGSVEPPCTLRSEAFAIDELTLSLAMSDIERCSLNLDGDPHDRTNYAAGWALWHVLNQWPADAEDLFSALRAAIAEQRLRWLVEVETCAEPADDDADYVRVGLYRGTDRDSDGVLELARDDQLPAVGERLEQSDATLVSARHGIGTVPASAFLDLLQSREDFSWIVGDGLAFDLVLTPDGALEGIAGLGLQPAIQELAGDMLAEFYTVKLNEGTSEYARGLDDNGDGVVTRDEFLNDQLAASLLSLDLDLFAAVDGEWVYWPRHDGEKDRLSVGVCFHAVPIALER